MWKRFSVNLGECLVLTSMAIGLCFSLNSKTTDNASKLVNLPSPTIATTQIQSDLPGEINASTILEEPSIAVGSFEEPAYGVLTSAFGERWGRNHNGIDIGGEQGSDILAADGGEVALAEWVNGYGNYILIDHKNGFQTAYAHCDELLVAKGEKVTQGQKIAYMGSTGNSTGPHLHFEVKLNGVYQDPLEYVLY